MSYPCIYNSFKECDSCGACDHEREVKCPICGAKLINNDELYFENSDTKPIGCTHCIYIIKVEDYDEEADT